MEEIWKDIKGYEGLYQISNYGNIRSLDRVIKYNNGIVRRHSGIVMSGRLNKNGYLYIILSKNGIKRPFLLHRIVAKHFLEYDDDKLEVDHINAIRTDNRVENLRWCTRKDNCNNPISIEHQKRAQQKYIHDKIKIKYVSSIKRKIAQYTLDGELVSSYDGLKQVCKRYGFDRRSIIRSCSNETRTAYGYK